MNLMNSTAAHRRLIGIWTNEHASKEAAAKNSASGALDTEKKSDSRLPTMSLMSVVVPPGMSEGSASAAKGLELCSTATS